MKRSSRTTWEVLGSFSGKAPGHYAIMTLPTLSCYAPRSEGNNSRLCSYCLLVWNGPNPCTTSPCTFLLLWKPISAFSVAHLQVNPQLQALKPNPTTSRSLTPLRKPLLPKHQFKFQVPWDYLRPGSRAPQRINSWKILMFRKPSGAPFRRGVGFYFR